MAYEISLFPELTEGALDNPRLSHAGTLVSVRDVTGYFTY